MIVFDCEQRSETWHQARAGIATASCFADVLATIKSGEAASRRNYRAQLVVERLTGRVAGGGFQSEAMRVGVERESFAREAYEVQTGDMVKQIGFLRHDTIEAGCSPDGLVGDKAMIEIKCPQPAEHLEYLKLPHNTAPAKYIAQIQGQLWIAEREVCDFVSFNPDFPEGLQLVVRPIYRDDGVIANLAHSIDSFMEEVRHEEAAVRAIKEAA